MKLGLALKLFLALLATSILTSLATGFAARVSFTHGFLGYLNEQGIERVESLVPAFAAAYGEQGDWRFLRRNPRAWFHILNPRPDDDRGPRQDRPDRRGRERATASADRPTVATQDAASADPRAANAAPGAGSADQHTADADEGAAKGRLDRDAARPDALPPNIPAAVLTGVDLRIGLLDPDKRYLAGNPQVGLGSAMRPIVFKGHVVGWLAVLPFQNATAAADVRFQERQLRALWLIAAGSVLLAALVAIALGRWLLSPVKRIANATHRLAAGDYSGRLDIGATDDIGRLAEDFNQLARTLERNEKMRRAFMADVSHELRTPLAVLKGELEALEDGVRPLTADSLRSLQAEVTTLSKLVSDLYDLSLSDVGALTYRKTDVDVGEILQLTLGAFRERLAAGKLTLETDIPEPGPLLMADESRLHQLFNNIVENSVRYTHAGGKLRVECREVGREIHIDFQDTAPGVPEDVLPQLFERFFRMDTSRNRASGGAGLGLAISKNIMDAHGGRIEARVSALGGVWISLVFRR
jgi:two-component system sensor histidine kinase BaeS